MKDYRYELIHGGPSGCGKPAFLMADLPKAGQTIVDTAMAHLNGDPCVSFGGAGCESCGAPLTRIMIGWVRERELEAA